MMNYSRVIVTGGAGFIGSHLVDQLISNNFKVRVIDNLSAGRLSNLTDHTTNSNFDLIEHDITKISATSSVFKNIDVIFHLAGIGDIVPSIEDPSEYLG